MNLHSYCTHDFIRVLILLTALYWYSIRYLYSPYRSAVSSQTYMLYDVSLSNVNRAQNSTWVALAAVLCNLIFLLFFLGEGGGGSSGKGERWGLKSPNLFLVHLSERPISILQLSCGFLHYSWYFDALSCIVYRFAIHFEMKKIRSWNKIYNYLLSCYYYKMS